MNLRNSFDTLKNSRHSESFDELESWLRRNRPRRRFSPAFKIAASFITLALLIVACSLPVDHQTELGFMITGVATNIDPGFKSELEARGIDPEQVEVSTKGLITGQDQSLALKGITGVRMILAKSNLEEAGQRKKQLEEVFRFQTVKIVPITDTIRKPLYESVFDYVIPIGEVKPQIKLNGGSLTIQPDLKVTIDSVMEARSIPIIKVQSVRFVRVNGQLQIKIDVNDQNSETPDRPPRPGM